MSHRSREIEPTKQMSAKDFNKIQHAALQTSVVGAALAEFRAGLEVSCYCVFKLSDKSSESRSF